MQLAMDKATVRTINGFGQMFVDVSNISKAGVNPYRGNEIPRHAELGLDADKVYRLLRCPAELAKAVDTFNGLPLLDRHIPVTADKPSQERIVGALGTDAAFDEPFLRNSLSVWTAGAIAGIKSKQLRELSCAYSYEADMTPGVYEGIAYDGIMRNIRGNHVALVEVGRAGPECVVGDSKLLEKPKMSKKLTANARAVKVALMAYLGPRLAQDAQIGDLTAIAGSVKNLKIAKNRDAVVAAVTKVYTPKLAQDADLSGLVELLDAVAGDDDDGLDVSMDDGDDMRAKLMAAGVPEGKIDSIIAMCGAADEVDKPKPDGIDKPAMDAAIKAATDKTRAETVAQMQAIRAAESAVEPHIGKIAIAQDSAENVYKLALDAAKIDLTGVHPSAYRAMVGMLPAAGGAVKRPAIAQDAAAGGTGFSAMFPNSTKMKGGV